MTEAVTPVVPPTEGQDSDPDVARFEDEGGPAPALPEPEGQASGRPDQPLTETPDPDRLAAEHMTYEGAPDPEAGPEQASPQQPQQ